MIDDLKGKKSGYADAYEQLMRDPCLIYPAPSGESEGRPFAYRLSGPLAKKVCSVRLESRFRLAFSMQPADAGEIEGYVVILYVGERDTRDRANDVYTELHDIFGVDNPPAGHVRPPCCDDGQPAIDEAELDEFMRRLRRVLRGR